MLTWLKALMPGNRRSFDRDPVDTEVRLSVGDHVFKLHIRDVSPGGAFLAPAPDLDVGVEGELHVPQIMIETPVRIVRRTDTGIGVEFLRDNVGAIVAGWTRGRTAR